MTQSGEGGGGGVENTFFSVTLKNFQKSGEASAPPAPPPPRALYMPCMLVMSKSRLRYSCTLKMVLKTRQILKISVRGRKKMLIFECVSLLRAKLTQTFKILYIPK